MPDQGYNFHILPFLIGFLDGKILFFEKMMIDADRMMISFDDLNYLIKKVHPDDNFLLVFIFFCEICLDNELLSEAG